jgi:dihydroxy-acid dehydratase
MLDGHLPGGLAGSGTIVWQARQELAAGRIDLKKFLEWVASSAPSVGHCNTMGTALSMNSMAEALGLSLPGCAPSRALPRARPDGLRDRQAHRRHGWEDLKPSDILTRKAFENAIVAASALGASTNCPPHSQRDRPPHRRQARQQDWDKIGYDIPLLVNCMPAGKYLGEAFHRAGRRADRHARALAQEEDPRRRYDRHRQDVCREPQGRQAGGRRGHQDLRQADAGQGGLRRALGQPVRLGDHEDLGDLAGVPQEVL